MNPRTVALVFYIFLMIMVLSEVPLNEYTMGVALLLVGLLILGLIFLLGYHYIIPSIKRDWRMGACMVYNKKYIVCDKPSSSEKVGYAFIKVVPEQPIADMDKDRRESFLQTVMGILSGTQFEAGVLFMNVKDRYGDNIKKRLESEKMKRQMFARSDNMRTRDIIDRINRELELLRQVPVILEGFYIAIVRDYGYDDDAVIQKLEADSRALISRLSGIGVTASVIWGEELLNILNFCLFGSLTQLSW